LLVLSFFKTTLFVALFLCAPALAGRKVTIACVDCYSSASLYPTFARSLAPEIEVEWILIQTHAYPEMFHASLSAFGSAPVWQWNTHDPDQQRDIVARLKAKGAYVLGGMCEGVYHACPLNDALGLPDNELALRDERRKKEAMAVAVGEYGIPSLLTRDPKQALAFADTLAWASIALKPNAGAAGIGFESFSKGHRGKLEAFLTERLASEIQIFGDKEDWIVQPFLEGYKYYVDTFTLNGVTKITGLWRYHMSEEEGLTFFIDRPLSLAGPLARQLTPIVRKINPALGVMHGSSHIEMLRETTTGRWYLLENNPRNAGAGIPALETRIWGISQLEMTLLAILDPQRLSREFASFPRPKLQDGFLLILPAADQGKLTAQGIDALLGLPGAFLPAPHYRPTPKNVEKSVNLKTAAGVFHFAGEPKEIRKSFNQALSAIQSERIIDYTTEVTCSTALQRRAFHARLGEVAEDIDWAFQP
jgi:hypothetical protein